MSRPPGHRRARRPIVPGVEPAPEDVPSLTAEAGARADLLREAFSRWASGVTVVGVRDGANVAAITATAFAPLSLDPALVVVCVGANATILPFLQTDTRFAISILGQEQRRLASLFADTGPLARMELPRRGDPVVPGALVGLVCEVDRLYPGGDHALVVGRVLSAELGGAGEPLVYYRREYRSLE